MEGSGAGTTRTCVSCGRAISFDANVCPYCGRDYRMPTHDMAQPPKKSALPIAGGILILIAGVLALAMGVFYLALDVSEIRDSGATIPGEISDEDLENIMGMCGALCLIFGFVAVIGGVLGVMRKHFALGIIGGIFGMLGIGFGFGALLAIIGLILVALSRKEFG